MVAGDFETSETESVLSYRVDNEADYGRLVCRSASQMWTKEILILLIICLRAENEAEGAAEPCIFIVTPSVR